MSQGEIDKLVLPVTPVGPSNDGYRTAVFQSDPMAPFTRQDLELGEALLRGCPTTWGLAFRGDLARAMRVPVINVSVVDLTFTAKRDTTVEEVNAILREAAQGELKGILTINDLPLVSIDFNHNPSSSVFDTTQTKVIGNLVKVLSWYDNEWGFSNRMLDTTKAMMSW